MQYKKVETTDNIFWTCCAIDNAPHTYNSMDAMVADLDWAGAGGESDDDVRESTDATEPRKEAATPDNTQGSTAEAVAIQEDPGPRVPSKIG